MVQLIFRGYSDDTFGEVNHFNIDCDNCAKDEPIEFLVYNNEYSIIVTGWYGGVHHMKHYTGHWMIGVSNYTEDDKDFPNWNIRLTKGGHYSYECELIIEAPDDVKLDLLK